MVPLESGHPVLQYIAHFLFQEMWIRADRGERGCVPIDHGHIDDRETRGHVLGNVLRLMHIDNDHVLGKLWNDGPEIWNMPIPKANTLAPIPLPDVCADLLKQLEKRFSRPAGWTVTLALVRLKHISVGMII